MVRDYVVDLTEEEFLVLFVVLEKVKYKSRSITCPNIISMVFEVGIHTVLPWLKLICPGWKR
jgi:hypothetical protein